MNRVIDLTVRIRTVSMSDRGQIVIPEDMRKDLGLSPEESIVLIEKDNEIVLRKESDVAKKILGEDEFWRKLSQDSLKRFWGKEDDVWQKIAEEDLK